MKYIIFDFDGTIGDSQALIVRTFQDTMRKMGREVKSAEECANTIGMRLSEAFALLYNSSIEDGEKCAQVYRDIFEENHASLLGFIHQMDLADCISSVVAQEDVVNVKPEPDMVFKALMEIAGREASKEDSHVLPDDLKAMLTETLVVGDMTFDVDMAHNAGVKACAVTYGNGTREQLAEAEWIIDDFAEILEKLKRL